MVKRRFVARRPREKVTYRRWGAVTAVTEIGPCRRLQRLRLMAVFAFGNTTTIAIQPLLKMKVIALARWTLWPNARSPSYLLFETNWSGSDQTYIPDFGRIMPIQWRSIWGATTTFPGAIPTTGLDAWVDEIDFGVGHFWTDYEPGASTHVIEQALVLDARVKRFVDDTHGVSAAEFGRRWRNLVIDVQGLL
ncbi:MAG: hypothetical protein ACXVRN_10615 [Solirubrobacteraceae bacterium]